MTGKCKAVAIYIEEDDRWKGKTLYLAIVERAKQEGLAGATVTKGIMGFGANSVVHTASILLLSEDLPVTVTIIDEAAKIERFLSVLEEMVEEGLVATWDVDVHLYRRGRDRES